MVNEPMPWQLTVAELRRVLEAADPNAVIGLEVPKGGIGNGELATIWNLVVQRSSGPIVILSPRSEAEMKR